MTAEERSTLLRRFDELCLEFPPLPGQGATPQRHRRLMEVAREDVSLAKLVEAHWDAISILAEAGKAPKAGARYAVWASEAPGRVLEVRKGAQAGLLHGSKMFCTGAGIVDRALVTVSKPDRLLLDIPVSPETASIHFDPSEWHTEAFLETGTSTLTCDGTPVRDEDIIGIPNWYVDRPGFWNGACGPAACWAGGAAGLLDVARRSKRSDPHTLVHLAAIASDVWAMESLLAVAGFEIDADPENYKGAQQRALKLRHLIEQLTTDVLARFARAYGPFPLSMDASCVRRFHETELYVRQCHGERDLETLAHLFRST